MATSYDKLHWLYPFPSKKWVNGDHEEQEIEVGRWKNAAGVPFIKFENITDHDVFQARERTGAVVIAPIGGLVTQVKRSEILPGFLGLSPAIADLDIVDIQILTVLGDGSRIFNELRGVSKLNPLIKENYNVVQGEWLGFATYIPPITSYHEAPTWYVWAHLPGDPLGGHVWGDDKALHPRSGGSPEFGSIGWQSESTGIDEFLSDGVQPAAGTPVKRHDRSADEARASEVRRQAELARQAPQETTTPPAKPNNGILFLAAAVGAYLVFGKGGR